MKRKIEIIVFDLDGTLIDSKSDIANAVNLTLGHFGIAPLPLDLISKYVGSGVMPLVLMTLDKNGIPESSDVIDIFADFYLAHLTDHTKLYDGVLDTLEHFRALKKIILTNKSNQFASPILEKLGVQKYFLRCYGRESFTTRKPDPGPLLSICSEFNASPGNIVMVGDTDIDMIAGKRAGAITVAAAYGFGELATLTAQHPDFQISHPIELTGLFDKVAL